ncbi:hypothetical protein Kpol_1031p23 [Vanderwaltozyma polyspora DSM 70294]|uniref:Cystathionine gamma-synthase n=1 Tax=Vanderwaltozyma polyspora (strain ATCC 22028 / DSM 70294 / BCRC 21397 / CBS 2163 / NBRC 10782 / NRRL Y-8283 / UCD 57-17) TaxID=436907 RepID=A7THV7_VANPO|nr:uncharacterized protein Kpol_1031p23 [Vanderwaltozyma polyspora DSM 70294]EDO18119.1 hypothetical protein Kpol_1031p23 [Vanderwaltozyma polyspora DSM 70294]
MVELSTLLIHADDKNNRVTDVAPPINVTTTFRYEEQDLIPIIEREDMSFLDERPVYSREGHPNGTRLETLFSEYLGGHAVIYSSGLSAYFAAIMSFNPKRIFMSQNYHGCIAIAEMFQRNGMVKKYTLDEIEQYAEKGDIVHLESPVNPFGTSYDIEAFAKRAHAKGALLLVDGTFAPPPLQNVWDFGADIVMHSATKYFGGHSDLLGGVLVVKDKKRQELLKEDRINLGTNIANLESYLLLRSLRTFEMRIMKQSENVTKIVKYLDENKGKYGKVLRDITHSSLQKEDFVKKQLKGGYNPVFSITLNTVEQCKSFASQLKYFQHATSLGGVESLVEWRALSDPHIDQTLVRVSVGCESADDLIKDLASALQNLQDEAN